jgi:hypothetical protein
MGPAAACAGAPPVANAGAACTDVRTHRTRETAPGRVDALSPASNPARLISSDAPVQRCFRVKARKIHLVSSSREHSIRYCRKSARWVLQQQQGLQGFPVGKHPGGHRHHPGQSAVPSIICCGVAAVPRGLRGAPSPRGAYRRPAPSRSPYRAGQLRGRAVPVGGNY